MMTVDAIIGEKNRRETEEQYLKRVLLLCVFQKEGR